MTRPRALSVSTTAESDAAPTTTAVTAAVIPIFTGAIATFTTSSYSATTATIVLTATAAAV